MFDFGNVLAGSYRGGSVAFSRESLLSGVGNRLCAKDLAAHSSFASSFETVEDVEHVLPLEEDDFVLVIDKGGRMYYVNCRCLTVLTTVHLGGRVTACAVDAGVRKVAVAFRDKISCWHLPAAKAGWQFSRINEWKAHQERCRTIRFSPDSNYLISCGDDHTVRFWSAHADTGFYPLMFTDSSTPIIAADFTEDMTHVVAVSNLGRVWLWRWHDGDAPQDSLNRLQESKAKILRRTKVESKLEEVKIEPATRVKRPSGALAGNSHDVMISGWWEVLPTKTLALESGKRSAYSAADYHRAKRLFVLGTSGGELATVQVNVELSAESCAQELSRVSVDEESHVATVRFNADGEWVAAGLPQDGGTLCVWEWRSGTFILKEKSIDPGDGGVTAVAVQSINGDSGSGKTAQLLGSSPNLMAAGYGDGRVVIWDTVSGFEVKRFAEHEGAVTGLCFTNQQHTLVSCSSTGEIKCYELLRMKCFRSMQTPNLEGDASGIRIPLGTLTVDGSGSLICAASSGSDCSIFLYSMQSGHLLDHFSGHTSPIVDLRFNQCNLRKPGEVAAVCMDGSVCIWDLLERDAGGKIVLESTGNGSGTDNFIRPGGFSVAWNPLRHNELAVALGGGEIVIWNVEDEAILGRIEGARDLDIGREKDQTTVVRTRDYNISFDRMAYVGADKILAVSQRSPRIYIYDLRAYQLERSWKMTHNRTLENLCRKLNAKSHADADLDLSDLDADELERKEARRRDAEQLPGAKSLFGAGDRLKLRKQFRVRDLGLSADSQELIIGTSHGAFCYRSSLADGGVLGGSRSRHSLYSSLTSFSPMVLDDKTTQKKYVKAIERGDLEAGLKLALRINNPSLIAMVYERVDRDGIDALAKNLASDLVMPMLNFVRKCFELHRSVSANQDPHAATMNMSGAADDSGIQRCSLLLEHHLLWLAGLLNYQKSHVESAVVLRPLLLGILKDLLSAKQSVGTLFDENRLTAKFFSGLLTKLAV